MTMLNGSLIPTSEANKALRDMHEANRLHLPPSAGVDKDGKPLAAGNNGANGANGMTANGITASGNNINNNMFNSASFANLTNGGNDPNSLLGLQGGLLPTEDSPPLSSGINEAGTTDFTYTGVSGINGDINPSDVMPPASTSAYRSGVDNATGDAQSMQSAYQQPQNGGTNWNRDALQSDQTGLQSLAQQQQQAAVREAQQVAEAQARAAAQNFGNIAAQSSRDAVPNNVQPMPQSPNYVDQYNPPTVRTTYEDVPTSGNGGAVNYQTAQGSSSFESAAPSVPSTNYVNTEAVTYQSNNSFRESVDASQLHQTQPVMYNGSASQANAPETIVRQHNQEEHQVVKRPVPSDKSLEAKPSQNRIPWIQRQFMNRVSANTNQQNPPVAGSQGVQPQGGNAQQPDQLQQTSKETQQNANETLNDVVARGTTVHRYSRSSVDGNEEMTEEELELMKKLGGNSSDQS